MHAAVVFAFVAVYLGMGLGRWPGLAIDRTGVALVGAVFLFAIGAVDGGEMLRAVDFPTLAILFSLMVTAAQVDASGLFDRMGAAIVRARLSPLALLAVVVGATGGLAALLTNDVVVWAMVPVVARGVRARGLDPRPFVIAMACAANAGSAATLVGNPQNLLIAQVGDLHFWGFLAACGVPAVLSLAVVFGVIAVVWRRRWEVPSADAEAGNAPPPAIDRISAVKAAAAIFGLVLVFSLPVPRAPCALAIAALLLLSRRLGTARMLGMVDWHLLLLFACLFIVTGAFVDSGLLAGAAESLAAGLERPWAAVPVALFGSNTIGNVPLVTLLLAVAPGLSPQALYGLAAYSTLAGNFLIVGSMANIIAVERGRDAGAAVSFAEYARVGVPTTVLSLGFAYLWLVYGFA